MRFFTLARLTWHTVTTPARLSGNEKFVLEEATCFIDAALNHGSDSHILVHCHKGEKRYARPRSRA